MRADPEHTSRNTSPLQAMKKPQMRADPEHTSRNKSPLQAMKKPQTRAEPEYTSRNTSPLRVMKKLQMRADPGRTSWNTSPLQAIKPYYLTGPLGLAVALAVVHALISLGPAEVRDLVSQWALLLPFNPGAGLPLHVTSLPGHGFVHPDWSCVLVNAGMIVAFAVISMGGIRAREYSQGLTHRPSLKFWLVFLAGVITHGLTALLWWGVSGVVAYVIGSGGGVSALVATAGYAIGGQRQLIRFGTGWAVINVVPAVVYAAFVPDGVAFGFTLWAASMGGFLAGAFLAPRFVKAFAGGSSSTMTTKQLLGLTGSAVLFMVIPNYFHIYGGVGGIILLVLAVISFGLVLAEKYEGLWFTGIGSICVALFTDIRFLSAMQSGLIREQAITYYYYYAAALVIASAAIQGSDQGKSLTNGGNSQPATAGPGTA